MEVCGPPGHRAASQPAASLPPLCGFTAGKLEQVFLISRQAQRLTTRHWSGSGRERNMADDPEKTASELCKKRDGSFSTFMGKIISDTVPYKVQLQNSSNSKSENIISLSYACIVVQVKLALCDLLLNSLHYWNTQCKLWWYTETR